MDQPDITVLLAVGVFTAAVVAALVADQPSRPRHYWCFPVLVMAAAAVNIGLTVALMTRPEPLTGAIVLSSALLLVYAAHRRARAVGLRWPPPRRRRPTR